MSNGRLDFYNVTLMINFRRRTCASTNKLSSSFRTDFIYVHVLGIEPLSHALKAGPTLRECKVFYRAEPPNVTGLKQKIMSNIHPPFK